MNGEKSTGKTIAIIALAIVCLVLIALQFVQKGAKAGEPVYEKFSGVEEDSFEYEMYKSCMDSCTKCEANCKDSLFREISFARNDESFCSKITEEWARTDCVNNINNAKAITENDKSYCNRITEEFMKDDCLASVTLAVAVEQGNIDVCDQSPEGRTESCRENWHYRMAIKILDETHCGHLADELMQDMCRQEVKMAKEMQQAEAAP